MTETDILEWARKHKKEFAERLLKDSTIERSDEPAAIFMAGLPGSGKTEFTKNWLENSGLKVLRLDMDEIASQMEAYSPSRADEFRGGASLLLSYIFDRVIDGKYDFIMDGTLSGRLAIQNIERVLKRGYYVKVFYIYQLPRVAWRYTIAREKVEHRAIKLDGFLEAYYKTLKNLSVLGEIQSDKLSVDILIKNEQNRVIETKENIDVKDIDKIVKIEYNKDRLREEVL